MIDPNINPHEAAVEILEQCIANGEHFAHDEEIVVLADFNIGGIKDKVKDEE